MRRNVHDGAAVENTTAAPKNLLPFALHAREQLRGGVWDKAKRHHSSVGGGGDAVTSEASTPAADDVHAGVEA